MLTPKHYAYTLCKADGKGNLTATVCDEPEPEFIIGQDVDDNAVKCEAWKHKCKSFHIHKNDEQNIGEYLFKNKWFKHDVDQMHKLMYGGVETDCIAIIDNKAVYHLETSGEFDDFKDIQIEASLQAVGLGYDGTKYKTTFVEGFEACYKYLKNKNKIS